MPSGAAPADAAADALKFEENDRLRGEISIGPVSAFGLLPKPSVGAALSLGLRWPVFGLAAEVRYFQAWSSSVGDAVDNQRSISVLAGMGAFSACWYPRIVFLCPVFQVAELGVHPNEEKTYIQTSHPFMMAQALRAGARWQVMPGAYLSAFGEVGVTITGAAYVVNGQVLWGPLPVNGILGLRFGGIIGRIIKD